MQDELLRITAIVQEITKYTTWWVDRQTWYNRWAPRTPNLRPMDFFLSGAMKDSVYNSKPSSLDDLEMVITTQFNAINSNKELCARV